MPKISLISVLLIAILCWGSGCSRTESTLELADLELVLGKLSSDVVVLGSKVVESTVTMEPSLQEFGKTNHVSGQLWLVTSSAPLPCPFSRDRKPTEGVAPQIEPNIRVEYDAFPVRVVYDVWAELDIKLMNIPSPVEGDVQTARGRISEWHSQDNQIRIRDFKTRDGWLSVVEVFKETQEDGAR